MDVNGRVVVVTGAAGGIGRALSRRFRNDGARVVASDLGSVIGACADVADLVLPCDVTDESEVAGLVEKTLAEFGRLDVFVANAGVTSAGGVEVPDDDWLRMWDVHVMAHVRAFRAVLPHWRERGEGWFTSVASAAGLLTEIGSAPYAVTKAASVALAEWLAITHHADGIHTCCVCPMGVATDFLDRSDPIHEFLAISAVTPEDVAESVLRGLAEGTFLILPHADVAEFHARKAADPERYLKAFRRLRQKLARRRAG